MRGGDGQGLEVPFLYHGEIKPGTLALRHPVVTEPVGARWINAYVAGAYEPIARSGPAAPGNGAASGAASERIAASPSGGRSTGAICRMTDGDQTGALVEG